MSTASQFVPEPLHRLEDTSGQETSHGSSKRRLSSGSSSDLEVLDVLPVRPLPPELFTNDDIEITDIRVARPAASQKRPPQPHVVANALDVPASSTPPAAVSRSNTNEPSTSTTGVSPAPDARSTVRPNQKMWWKVHVNIPPNGCEADLAELAKTFCGHLRTADKSEGSKRVIYFYNGKQADDFKEYLKRPKRKHC